MHIYRYVTEGTFDSYLWQTLENKQKFISQIMTSKSPVRSCEDIDETALSFAEIKALCAGDPRIKEKMDLDIEVARLKLMKANHQSQQYRLEDSLLKTFPEQIEQYKGYIEGFEADMTRSRASGSARWATDTRKPRSRLSSQVNGSTHPNRRNLMSSRRVRSIC